MYTPTHFRENDPQRILQFMQEHSFASVITWSGSRLEAQHVPVMTRKGREEPDRFHVEGHFAAKNPAIEALRAGHEVLIVFTGPHAYVSPTLYATPGVPTWNYAAVHVYGQAKLFDEPAALESLLQRQTSHYEETNGTNWTLNALSPEQRERLIKNIVGFELTVERFEAKFKLSQNRAPADREAVRDYLDGRSDTAARQIARLMADFSNA